MQSGTVTLNDATSPQFAIRRAFRTTTPSSTSPSRQGRTASTPRSPIPPTRAGNNARVRLILIDPLGRFAAHSLPQGVGNYGNVDVVDPAPGTWTGVIFGDVAAKNGTNGTVPWQVATQQYVPFASVWPSSIVLRPGQSQTVYVSATTPSSPGDAAGSIVVNSNQSATNTSIPVTLRSLVPVGGGFWGGGLASGSFSGVLTGGNGRPPGQGQVDYFEFNVGRGVSNITANVSLTNDGDDTVASYLISPDGDTLGYGQNASPGTTLTAYTLNPVPGTWTLIVEFAEPIVGDELSQPFTGNIEFNAVHVSAPGLPNGPWASLKAGTPVTVPVSVTNNGAGPEYFFIDPRLDATSTIELAPFYSNPVALPLAGAEPTWMVPTQTSSVTVSQSTSLPAMFDYGPYPGDPDLPSANLGPSPLCSTSESATYAPSGGTVTGGLWGAAPTECGPYSAPAPAATATINAFAVTQGFDTSVTSPTTDIFLGAINPSVLSAPPTVAVIDPGQTAVIDVVITPSGAHGAVVNGTLYVDELAAPVAPYGQVSGDELAALPYSYRIR